MYPLGTRPMTLPTLTFGQSADPDDAFMAWALATGEVQVPGHAVQIHFDDIQSLNELAVAGRLELTALSAGAYPLVADRYRILRSGASFGQEYGPVVVGRAPPTELGPHAINGMRVAVPGLQTSAYTLLRIHAGNQFEPVPMPFDTIMGAVADGSVDAGLIIHEGQLTYREHGLHLLCEPARAWHQRTALPVPLGLVGVRRDLGEPTCRLVASAFKASIEAALAHPEAATAFAAKHGRGLDPVHLRTFVDQYVDDATLDMGDRFGVAALRRFYSELHEAGLLPAVPPLDLLD